MGLLNQIAQPTTMPSSYMTLEQWLQNPENAQAAEQLQAQYDMQDSGKSGADAGYNNWLSQQNAQAYGIDPTHIGAAVNTADTRNLQNIASIDELLTRIANNTNPDFPTLQMTPERRQQVLQQVAQAPAGADWRDLLTPEERQPIDIMSTYESQNQGHDPMAKALMAAMIGGFGAIAGPSMFAGMGEAAGGLADAAWGVNPATTGGTMTGGFGLGTAAGEMGAGLAGAAPLGSGMYGLGGGTLAATGGALGTGLAGISGMEALPGLEAGALTNAAGGLSNLTPPTGTSGGTTAAQQAIDGSSQTIYDAAANAGVPGYDAALASGVGQAATTAGAGTALSRILNGTGTAADWTSVLGTVGSSALGMAGANAQGDAYKDVADKYMALGAPYRGLLEQSYQPGFSMANQPDFQNALDVGAQAAARATSAKVGNPVDNPGAYAEMQKYISGSLALPQLNTYRSQLGSFGQLGTNTAGTNDTQAAGQTSGMYNALGYGLGQLTQPQSNLGSLSQLLNSGRFF